MHTRYYLALIVCLLFARSAAAVPSAGLTARYDVVLDKGQRLMKVKVCFNGTVPERLVNGTQGTEGLLKTAYVVVDGRPRSLVFRNGAILTHDLYGQHCLHYQVDFVRVLEMGQDLRYSPEHKNHVRTRAGDWLWFPDGFTSLDIEFHLDDGYRVSTPWRRLAATDGGVRYLLHSYDDNEKSMVYFGRFPEYVLTVANSQLILTCMSDVDPGVMKKLIDWIEYGAHALTLVYGEFPLAQVSVRIFPVGRNSSAVPWGDIRRDGGPTINLYVDQTRPLNQIMGDWTLIHEFSHTLHPHIGMEGRWLTEGLATYYQNILQARVHTLNSQQAWTKLHQGFNRGRKETEPGLSLQQVSENMLENHNYMRVYWSGAALWLKADLLLRTRYDSTLDGVLKRFKDCCLQRNTTWQAREYMQTLDRLSQTPVFTSLYDRYAMSDKFPDLGDVYSALGLRDRGQQLAFDKDAKRSDLIEAIMSDHALP